MRPTEKDQNETQDEHRHHYGYKRDLRTAMPQIIAVNVKNLLLLGYGMTLGFPTILIPAVSQPRPDEVLRLDTSQISWIGSINLIVVPLGCALSGAVTTPMGRRRAMQAVNLPFLLAWLLFHFSGTAGHLYGALFLTGLAGGLLEAPVLTYVAEITQPHLRGALAATSSMCIIIGVFTQFLFGTLLYWRSVALVNITVTVLAVLALFFVPESPHWLVSRQRHAEARKSLQWLRGWTTPQAVEEELKDIQVLFKRKKVGNNEVEDTWSEKVSQYLHRSFLVPFSLVSYSFFVGHFSGMTTLQTYAVSIFQSLEAPMDKYNATLVLGLVQIAGTASCVVLVRVVGKRVLTLISSAGAATCCLLLAGYDVYIQMQDKPYGGVMVNGLADNSSTLGLNAHDDAESVNPYSWIPMTLLFFLAFITHTGIRMLPWILIGEVFSAKTRAGAAGLASAVGYVFGFVTNKVYIGMVDLLSIWGTYGFYGLICLTGCVVFYFILPETEGKKLNDIENHFAGVKKLSNEVYRSKKRKNLEISKMREIKGAVNQSFEGDNTNL
ncbi:unnamed protein product, partial [Iphiclides podalirius]